jgi:hypothetical protein
MKLTHPFLCHFNPMRINIFLNMVPTVWTRVQDTQTPHQQGKCRVVLWIRMFYNFVQQIPCRTTQLLTVRNIAGTLACQSHSQDHKKHQVTHLTDAKALLY